MNTIKIAALIEAVRCGSISQAAEKLGYAQSGLSYILNSVEVEIGLPLIQRNHNGISLTENGKLLLPYLEAVIEKESALNRALKQAHAPSILPIRVGLYPSWMLQLVPDMVAAFSAKHPDVSFEFHTGVMTLNQLLDEKIIDLAICEEAILLNKPWEFIMEDEIQVALHRGSPHADRDCIKLEELSDYTLVPSVNHKHVIYQAFSAAGLTPPSRTVRLYSEDGSMMLSAVSRNPQCITFISHLYAEECPYNVQMLPLAPPLTRKIGVSLQLDAARRPEIQEWVAFLKSFDYSRY